MRAFAQLICSFDSKDSITIISSFSCWIVVSFIDIVLLSNLSTSHSNCIPLRVQLKEVPSGFAKGNLNWTDLDIDSEIFPWRVNLPE